MSSDLSISPVLPARAVQPMLQRWALGQMLSATVIGQDSANSTLVEIDGQQFRAASGLSLAPGTRLPVRVAQLGDVPVLEIQSRPASDASDTVRAAALRELLPKQHPQMQGLRELAAVATRLAEPASGTRSASLSAEVRAVITGLPALDTLAEPRALRSALAQSGTGLEHALARAVASATTAPELPAMDFKWQLLELRAHLDTASGDPTRTRAADTPASAGAPTVVPPANPASMRSNGTHPDINEDHAPADPKPSLPQPVRPETSTAATQGLHRQLAETIDGMLARVTSLQLQMADAAANGTPLGLFEIPVLLNETPQSLLLQVEGGGAGTDPPTAAPLTITLSVPITNDEELLVRMTLQAGTLNVVIWSDTTPLRNALEARREDLRNRLEQGGFSVAGVNVTPLALRREIPYPPTALVRTSV